MPADGLYTIKPWFVRRLRRVEDALVARRVSADALTYAAVGVAATTGAVIAAGALLDRPIVWLAVGPLVLVRLALNALDGSVARRTGSARPFGQALNEVCDRVADACVIAPIALVAPPALALGALVAAFAASFTGVIALGVTGTRDYRGPMGKADRMAVVAVGGVLAVWWSLAWDVACIVLLCGAVTTAVSRLRRLRAAVNVPMESLHGLG